MLRQQCAIIRELLGSVWVTWNAKQIGGISYNVCLCGLCAGVLWFRLLCFPAQHIRVHSVHSVGCLCYCYTYVYFVGYDRNKSCNEIFAFCQTSIFLFELLCHLHHSIMLQGYHQIIIIIITLRIDSAIIEQELNYIIITIIIIIHLQVCK
jgi:hypothetical protein